MVKKHKNKFNSMFIFKLIYVFLLLLTFLSSLVLAINEIEYNNTNFNSELNTYEINYWKEEINITILPIIDEDLTSKFNLNYINLDYFSQNIFPQLSNEFKNQLIVLFYQKNLNKITILQSKDFLTIIQISSINDIFLNQYKKDLIFLETNEDNTNLTIDINYLINYVNIIGDYVVINYNLAPKPRKDELISFQNYENEEIKVNYFKLYLNNIYFYLILFLSIAIIFLLKYYFKLTKNDDKRNNDKSSEFKELREYVLDNISKGYNLDQIKVYLIQNNYDKKIIEEVLNSINK